MFRVLDLFTGVGGARVGYERAGAEVTGVDINPQPDYPVPARFHQANVLDLTPKDLQGYDLVAASSPCQFDAEITKGTNKHLRHRYPNLYPQVRELLEASGVPYVIETTSIPQERVSAVLCGEMFDLRVIRHRKFEFGGWTAERPKLPKHRGLTLGMRHGKLITEENGGYYYAVYGDGGYKGTVKQWQDAMGIHWTDNRKSIAEAIPPAYTEWVGTQFKKWRAGQ
jgi:DNA (cytosine-5)-methyltransferase 1